MKNTFLFLARHGETVWNQAQKFQGDLDSPLTALGKQQAAQVGEVLSSQSVDLIVSSNLGRAITSAEICQQTLAVPLLKDEQLNERNLGTWQGECVDDLTAHTHYDEALHQLTHFKPPQGESAIDCGKRIEQALLNIAKKHIGKRILVICHGEAKRCLFATLGTEQQGNAYQLYQNGAVSPLVYDSVEGNLQYLDDRQLLASLSISK